VRAKNDTLAKGFYRNSPRFPDCNAACAVLRCAALIAEASNQISCAF
jgi:hypothetical protein